ncbi:MAG: hypothetical protein R3D56_03970 [Paracoccaceae bacterium]
MATLNTMRAILKDARMREQAGAIRGETGASSWRCGTARSFGSRTWTVISARRAGH